MTELSGYVLEPLRVGGEFVLYRGRRPGKTGPVLVLAPSQAQQTPADLRRLEHEYALANDLDPAWAVRPLAIAQHEGRSVLLLENYPGNPLDSLIGRPLELARFLRIAIALASALRQVHKNGLIHKDIKPANVLVDDVDKVRLTGFGIASHLPRERQPALPPEVIAGTFAYMAPEQTGRMNRSIDARSDLYSLGITLYEMITGTLPFSASDPMEWIHCHMARRPVPPGERVSGIPPAVEAIILKLLAKNAEDRYQTAAGVEVDLQRCLTEWEAHGRIGPFVPGAYDASDFLLVPEKLYGRDVEIGALLAAFERVVKSGMTGFVVVSGYSGIGKSSIVNELHKVLVPTRAFFAAGKFDQYKRDIPYATLVQAFHSLVRQLLNKNDAELSRWRQALLDALGPNGQLMVNMIPELALIIGEQPPVADLAPQDAQNRFYLVFRRFLGVFARPEHPLALFLDDLQWLDAATLELLERLVVDAETRHLLLVGAYRDNEVDPSHPLAQTLAAIRNAGGRVQEIALGTLKFESVRQIVADALRADPQQVHQLAELVFEKTGGNPFFANQFIATLADEGMLAFEADKLVWRWDIDLLRAKGVTGNVVDLIGEKLNRLSDTTQDALKYLACLGNTAQTATLSTVLEKTEEDTREAYWQAVQAGLVVYRDDAFTFLHDRVQEAAYALIPDEERAATHLRIGRILACHTASTEFHDGIFEAVNQLNRGVALIQSPEERERVAEINLAAGKWAKASTAYASALNYLTAGEALLTEESWSRCYALTFEAKFQRASCELLSANFGPAEQLITELLLRAVSKADKANAYRLKIELHVLRSENAHAVDCALEGLRLFGIEMSAHPSRAEVEAAYDEVWRKLGGRPIESLVDLPRATDPDFEAAMGILSVLFAPAVFTDENLVGVHLCHMVTLTLERGATGASTHAFGWFGIMLGHLFGRYADGYQFGQLARALAVRNGFVAFEAKTLFSLELVTVWTRPITEALDAVRAAFTAGVESGDVTIACYSCNHAITDMLTRGDPLDKVWQETERGIAFARKANFRDVADIIVAQQRFIQNMRGNTLSFSTFDEGGFQQDSFEAQLTADRMATMVCWYWIIKGQARFIFGDLDEAAQAFERAASLLWASPSHIQNLDYFYFSALALAALDRRDAGDPVTVERRERMRTYHEQLGRWAQSCPETFAGKHALVGAELARIQGRALDAENLYEESIRCARKNGFVHDEALANELAARFYTARGFVTISEAYLRNARSCYQRWGAAGKVRQMDLKFPQLRPEKPLPQAGSTVATPAEQLDLATVIALMQAVSSEIDLKKLIDKFMATAIEHAGGDRALLILPRGDDLCIQAEAKIGREKIEVQLRQAQVSADEVPESIIRYVAGTQDAVLLSDAADENQFSGDSYLDRRHCKSILCLPLTKQTRLIGVLYIENTLTMHAFTPARISLLTLLASQAAISLENASLYTDLQHTEAYLAEAQRLSHTGSFAFSAATGELLWSDEVYRIYEFDPATKITWEKTFQRVHPEEVNLIQKILERVSLDGRHFNIDHRLMMSDGSVKHLHVIVHGEKDEAGNARYVGTVMDVTESKRAQERLQASLKEKDALLKEVHHRVKNNLQLISSLLHLQADRIADPAVAEGFTESRNRVRSMALVHENLYRAGNLARVSMAAHIQNLCAHLVRVYGVNNQRVDLVTEIEDVELDIDRAITAGLVVNELVSNALKYAFPANREGQIRVELKASGARRYVLAVMDDGVGLPAECDPDYSDTLGLQLVHDLTRQLHGTITVQREFGTTFVIRFDVGDDQESLQ